jgi:hypothetical protein
MDDLLLVEAAETRRAQILQTADAAAVKASAEFAAVEVPAAVLDAAAQGKEGGEAALMRHEARVRASLAQRYRCAGAGGGAGRRWAAPYCVLWCAAAAARALLRASLAQRHWPESHADQTPTSPTTHHPTPITIRHTNAPHQCTTPRRRPQVQQGHGGGARHEGQRRHAPALLGSHQGLPAQRPGQALPGQLPLAHDRLG